MPEVKEKTEKAPNKERKFEVSYCRHDKGDYSLTIQIDDCHTSLSSYHYTHRIGCRANISVFDLSPNDIKALGEALLREAFKIETEG